MKWYRFILGFVMTDEGQPSLMRLIALAGAVVGAIVIFNALQIWHAGGENVVAMAVCGAGLFGGGEAFKAIQKRFEMKK